MLPKSWLKAEKGAQNVSFMTEINLTICEKNHEVFERVDNNLFMGYPKSVYELYFLEFKFKHLDGRIIQIEPLHNGDLQNSLMKKKFLLSMI